MRSITVAAFMAVVACASAFSFFSVALEKFEAFKVDNSGTGFLLQNFQLYFCQILITKDFKK